MGLRVSLSPSSGTSQEGICGWKPEHQEPSHKQRDVLGDLIPDTVFTGVTLL